MASWRVLAYSGLPATPSLAAHDQMESFVGRTGLGVERADQSTMMWVSKSAKDRDSPGRRSPQCLGVTFVSATVSFHFM